MVTRPRDKLTYSEPIATGEITISAAPDEVYRLISDPVAMAECAEELCKARWIRGATEARVGNWFAGSNRNGVRRWVTHAEITEADPGRRFAYRVRTPFFVPISRWEYDISPDGDGSRVTVTNWLRVPGWFVPLAIFITGEPDRVETNRANIATTLTRVKARIEGREWRRDPCV